MQQSISPRYPWHFGIRGHTLLRNLIDTSVTTRLLFARLLELERWAQKRILTEGTLL